MKKNQSVFMLLGAGQWLCYLFLLFLANLKNNIIACEAGFFTAFFLYVASLYLLKNHQKTNNSGFGANNRPFLNRHLYLICILLFSICFRLTMWFSPPTLSDDIYRYVWEGKMVAAGVNPFEHPPSDPSLERFRDKNIFPNINHSHLATIYPPLSLFIFSLAAQISPTLKTMNFTFILFDILTILVLLITLRALKMDMNRVAIYALNPLIIMEFAGNGHVDSAGIFFMFLSFYFFTKHKNLTSIFSLSFAFLSKLIPVIFLPFILTRRKVIHIFSFFLITCIFYAPFLSAGNKIFNSLTIYSQQWIFNASLYELFFLVFQSGGAARRVSGIIFVIIAIFLLVWYKSKLQHDAEKSLYLMGFIALGSLLILSPVFHPWYLCWVIPFLVIYPSMGWIYLSGSVFLSYMVLKGYAETGLWEERLFVKMVEYVPFYGLLLYTTLKRFIRH